MKEMFNNRTRVLQRLLHPYGAIRHACFLENYSKQGARVTMGSSNSHSNLVLSLPRPQCFRSLTVASFSIHSSGAPKDARPISCWEINKYMNKLHQSHSFREYRYYTYMFEESYKTT